MQSPLFWAGNKKWLTEPMNKLFSHYKDTHTWVEPFAGSAALAFGMNLKEVKLCDKNFQLMNFYNCVKHSWVPQLEMINDPAVYYQRRGEYNEGLRNNSRTLQQLADYFFYLNRTCYAGVHRSNAKGEFTAPFGGRKRIPEVRWEDVHELVSHWGLHIDGYQNLFIASDDFVYLDPPYCGTDVSYDYGHWTSVDFHLMLDWLPRHNPIVSSNRLDHMEVMRHQERGFNVYEVQAPRGIVGRNLKNNPELLAFRMIPQRHQLNMITYMIEQGFQVKAL